MATRRGVLWGWVPYVVAALVLAETGCGPELPPPKLSPETQALVGCSETLTIMGSRKVGDDVVYTLDACGTAIELERGWMLPRRRRDLTEVSEEHPLSVPARVTHSVDPRALAIVRRKVQSWCVGTPPADPDAIGFYCATPAELAECRQRLSATLVPVGTDQASESGVTSIWVQLGQYVFTVRDTFYEPPCSHKALPEMQQECESAAQRGGHALSAGVKGLDASQRASASDEDAGSQRAIKNRLFARTEFATGYMANTDEHRPFEGVGWGARLELGAKLTPDVGIGWLLGSSTGFSADLSNRPDLLQNTAAMTFYPIADSGFHLGGGAGFGLFSYGFKSTLEPMPVFAAAVGADTGTRGRQAHFSWTGGTVNLRGTYAPASDHTFREVLVTAGAYFW